MIRSHPGPTRTSPLFPAPTLYRSAGAGRTPIAAAMAEAGCLAVVLPVREVLIRPRADALTEARDLDSSRLDVAFAALPSHTLSFQHGVDNVRNAVRSGEIGRAHV